MMSAKAEEKIDLRCGLKDCVKGTGTYALKARCDNCGWSGEAVLTKGHKPPYRAECPACGCNTVSMTAA